MRYCRFRGFTLIELLIVIAILSVLTAVILPNFGAMGGTRVSIAVQDTIQMAKFARNMAVLNQVPIQLSFDTRGTISVKPQPRSEILPIQTETQVLAQEPAFDLPPEPETSQAPVTKKDGLEAGNLSQIETVRQCQGVVFGFLEYSDTAMSKKIARRNTGFSSDVRLPSEDDYDFTDPEKSDVEGEDFAIAFRSNGTCRPFKMQVKDANGGRVVTISFDVLGTGKVEED